jgi:hypothetical protein
MSKSLIFLKSHFVKIICCLLTLNNLRWIYFSINSSPFNQDEYQHTHIAWNSYQGLILYKDFFEHHGPLYAFFNSFILSNLENPASFDTLILFRKISFVAFCLILIMIFFITNKIFKERFDYAFIAITTLTFWPAVVGTTCQVRPDTLQNLLMLIGFYFLISHIDSSSNKKLILAGLFFGFMLMFNFKTIIIIIAIIITIIIQSIQEKENKKLLDLLFLLVSIIFIFGITSFYFYSNGAFSKFIQHTIIENFSRFADRKVNFPIFFEGFKINFLTDGLLLSIFSILSLFTLKLKNYKHKLLFMLAVIPLYGTYKGLHWHYNLINLSYFTIISSKFIYEVFCSLKPSKLSLVVRVITLVYLAFMVTYKERRVLSNIFHIYLNKVNRIPHLRTKENIDFALTKLDRNQVILNASYNTCPSFIFNTDESFQWCWNQPNKKFSAEKKVRAIAISDKDLKEAIKLELNFAGREYQVFNGKYGPLCLVINKEYIENK